MPTSLASLIRSAAAHGVVANALLNDSSLNTSSTRIVKFSTPVSLMPRTSAATYSRLFAKAVAKASGRISVDSSSEKRSTPSVARWVASSWR